jgi:hypothetical protein
MAISSLTYTPPIRRDAVGRTLDYHLLETAAEQYAAGEFLASAQTVFQHLFPDGEAPDLSKPFSFTQGSSLVTARIEDGVCFLSVPMVRLPAGGGGVAALRYVLTRINGSGQLAQARLHGEDVYLEFNEKLSALHPQKLIEVLRRMPVQADQHDDWMESQFGVTPLARATIESLAAAELEQAEQVWQAHWNDVEELLKEAQRKRSIWFLNEVTSFSLQRIRFTLPLGGSVLPRLLEGANTFNDADVDPRKRETTLAKCIKDMRAITGEELRRSLGHVEYAISPHAEGTPARLSNFFGPGNYTETIEKYRASGQYMEAALPLIGTYYYLLATHAWPDEIRDAMKGGLVASSGKPWRDAADLLRDHADELVERFGGEDEEADDADEDSDEAAAEGGEEDAQ